MQGQAKQSKEQLVEGILKDPESLSEVRTEGMKKLDRLAVIGFTTVHFPINWDPEDEPVFSKNDHRGINELRGDLERRRRVDNKPLVYLALGLFAASRPRTDFVRAEQIQLE